MPTRKRSVQDHRRLIGRGKIEGKENGFYLVRTGPGITDVSNLRAWQIFVPVGGDAQNGAEGDLYYVTRPTSGLHELRLDGAGTKQDAINAVTAGCNCIFCEQNGDSTPATCAAPQRSSQEQIWSWEAICDSHADGWWDGSDNPEPSPDRPEIVRVMRNVP